MTLHRFGMPSEVVAARQLSLAMLNNTLDALVLIVCGTGLTAGLFAGTRVLLTLLPAAVASLGVARRRRCGAHRAARRRRAARQRPSHPKIAGSLGALADAVTATQRVLLHSGGRRVATLAFAMLRFVATDRRRQG
jgi:hypothetical protein